MAEKNHAQRYRDAVWASSQLTPVQRLVALCYGEHAYGADTAWVAQRRLKDRTGIRSFSTATSVVESLVEAGWLGHVGQHVQHQQRVVYRLTVPDESVAPEAKPRQRDTAGRFATGDTAPATGAVDAGPSGEQPLQPVEQANRSTDGGQPLQPWMPNRSTGWRQPLQPLEPTAPLAGDELVLSPDDSLLEESGRDGALPPDAATLRAASGVEPLEEQEPAMSADDARAAMRQLLAGRRPAKMSHWTFGTAPVGEPNPHYDPVVAAGAPDQAFTEGAA